MALRLGIFGGSFDPIHMGHLLLAEICRDSLKLDRVRFLIANVSPLKTDRQVASNKDRIEMVKLAIGGNPDFELDTREMDRGGISYTIDSVRAIASENPDAELFLLMGADVLVDLAKWREPTELFRMITPCVIARGGVGEPQWEMLRPYLDSKTLSQVIETKVVAPQIEISSSELKARIRRGQTIRYQVPPAVELVIREKNLYRLDVPS
ncbi:MAG: nicotinate-nucleotide adenylyltransferase [Pirellula sp.]|nr:nicotinate-nucleotide adenylyltransferase [Pirellula sp.]